VKALDLIALALLAAIAIALVRYLAVGADLRWRNRRLRSEPWRRTEYVDDGGATHVVLRRSIRDSVGTEIMADNDIEIDAVPGGVEDFDDRLARARLSADLSVSRMNYRRRRS
jgi:hypothetical protein